MKEVVRVPRRAVASPTAGASSTGGTFVIQLSNPRVALTDASVSSVEVLVRKQGESSNRPSPPVEVLDDDTLAVALTPTTFGVNSSDDYNETGLFQLTVVVKYADGSQDVYEPTAWLELVDTLEEDL